VNNAGRNYTMPALNLEIDEVRDLFETNLYGVMRMCQAFAPLLIEAKGCIVQIGSLTAVMPYVLSSAYNASKAALHQYSRTLRTVRTLNSLSKDLSARCCRRRLILSRNSHPSV